MLNINEECPICLDILRDKYILTECGHHFHKECIKQVINKKCPICRNIFKLFDNKYKSYISDFEYIINDNSENIISDDGEIFPINFVINNLNNTNYLWNWDILSIKIPINIIENNKLYPWNWVLLTDRMSMEFIRNNRHYNWDWYKLSSFGTDDILMTNFHDQYDYWDWDKLSKRLSIYFIMENKYAKWNWNIISNIHITDTINIEKYKYIFDKINWHYITESMIKNNLNFIKKNPHYNWDIQKLIIMFPEKIVQEHVVQPNNIRFQTTKCIIM